MMTMMLIISAKIVVHKLLKSCWCISKPFRHYQHSKEQYLVQNAVLPFVSRRNPDKMVRVLEVDLV